MAEFGPEEAELRLKKLLSVNMLKFSKGFEFLDSLALNLERDMELSRKEGTPEEVRLGKARIEKTKTMRSALEKGDPKLLIDHIIETINNNLRFVKEYGMEELMEENPNRFDVIKNLLGTLEQLKRGE